MAVDFEKIKHKVEQLSGNLKKKSVMWGPKPNKTYEVRILPWPDGNDGQPFKERSFYYNIGGGRSILAPSQFGKPDPIQNLITKLRNAGTPAAFEQAKQFYPKRRYYAPVIVRGEEAEGVKLWSFGKQICESLLQAMLGDFGDVTDLKAGRDITVVCTQTPGRQFPDTKVTPRVKETAAGPAKDVKVWLDSVPKLEDIYKEQSFDEIEKRVTDHLNGTSSSSDGTESKPGNPTAPSTKASTREAVDDAALTSSIDDVYSRLDDVVES